MSLSNELLTKQPAPPPPIDLEEVSLVEALELALIALLDKSELYIIAAKMTAAMGQDAPPEAKKDTGRRRRLLSAAEVLRTHKASLIPF
jgi:hypothetical protein